MSENRCELLHDNGCGWCGKSLRGKQKRWCSRQCARTYRINHRWTDARQAKRLAAAWYECNHCGYLYQQEHIQVNHIEPIHGKHGVWGCHHHADNLEVLCLDCHAKETTRQRNEGLI